MKKRRIKYKKGDVGMPVSMKTAMDMDNLKKRAMQRRISFSGPKDEKDIKIENDFFVDLKESIYAQIARDKKWN